jgi:uncharacterized membrane protein YfcA
MLWGLIAALALLQSWFGVGLLLLGTPLLLLLGRSYTETLWTLLPASLVVSGGQLWLDAGIPIGAARGIIRFGIPGVAVGLLLWMGFGLQANVGPAVAIMLVVTVVLRSHSETATRVRAFAQRHEAVLVAAIGVVHGATNMGGSLLLDYAAARHSQKLAIRQQVAVSYVVFVAVQLVGLLVASGTRPEPTVFGYAVLAGAVFMTIGRRSFHRFDPAAFSRALNGFLLIVAGVLVWRSVR